VVLVRVGEDDEIEPPIPRRDPGVERHDESRRIGSAVDEEPGAAVALHEDRVALAHVEHADPDPTVRPSDGRDADSDDRGRDQQRDCALPPADG
jgi:hypothetical protein